MPQRFPVLIRLDTASLPADYPLRVGASSTVTVDTTQQQSLPLTPAVSLPDSQPETKLETKPDVQEIP
ncbi:hypothetical protein JCM19237_4034 [Photobacterium aphoticum]|uniref:Membrane fusion component of tripartite multidrug resistance system n=1 Tax=Photobacterium aphoticum TaxID=754436 RepID=A0A090R2R5_9GAMM|nr:hypothetical protein JCM19237_4034 [Photobacterium aphoticum]